MEKLITNMSLDQYQLYPWLVIPCGFEPTGTVTLTVCELSDITETVFEPAVATYIE